MLVTKKSKGEKVVANLLRQGGIQYKQEVSFRELKGAKELLRFDFGVFNKGKLLALIEIDGIQHFEYTPYFHKNPSTFCKQKEYDIRKNRFCILNNIPLIRIPYWELEDLTLEKIFYNKNFIVKTPIHNMILINQKKVR